MKCEKWTNPYDTSMRQNRRVPNKNQAHDLPNTAQALYPLSYKSIMESGKVI